MEFVKIQDYNNYSINIFGDIRNDKSKKILKNFIPKSGYYSVFLCKNGISKSFLIHRLIALHFLPNPDNKPFIDHQDNNKLNNSIDNLRWCNSQENNRNTIKSKNCSSIYKGVVFNKKNNKWMSSIYINKKCIYFGCFDTEKEGAEKYNNYINENNLTQFFKLNIF